MRACGGDVSTCQGSPPQADSHRQHQQPRRRRLFAAAAAVPAALPVRSSSASEVGSGAALADWLVKAKWSIAQPSPLALFVSCSEVIGAALPVASIRM